MKNMCVSNRKYLSYKVIEIPVFMNEVKKVHNFDNVQSRILSHYYNDIENRILFQMRYSTSSYGVEGCMYPFMYILLIPIE